MGSAFEVSSKVLGAGFLEKSMNGQCCAELALRGVSAETQASFPVCYKGQYVANLVPIPRLSAVPDEFFHIPPDAAGANPVFYGIRAASAVARATPSWPSARLPYPAT